jgi:hypothetical protein
VWPFGPKEIEERYLDADPRTLDFDEDDRAAVSASEGTAERRG